MSSTGKGSLARLTWQGLLVAISLLLVARAVQLAVRTPVEPDQPQAKQTAASADVTAKATAITNAAYQPHAEIARLYMTCPASAVVNWDDVVECAQRGEFDAAVARVGEAAPAGWSRRHSGQVPRIAYPTTVRVAALPNRVATAGRIAAADNDGWLVDPNDWYSDDDRQRIQSQGGDVLATEPAGSPDAAQPEDAPAPQIKPAESEPADEPSNPVEKTDEPAVPLFVPREETQTTPADVEPAAEPALPADTSDWHNGPLFVPPHSSSRTVSPSDDGDTHPPAAKRPPEPAQPHLPDPSQQQLPALSQPPDDRPADEPPPTPSPTEGAVTPPERLPAPAATPSFDPPVLPGVDRSSPADASVPPADGSLFAPPPKSAAPKAADKPDEEDPHLELFSRNCYPSARECGKCHERIYEEWSNSSHAYAMVSPMFHKFEQKITELSQGTVGYFCYRCHSPVGTAMCIDRTAPLWELPEVAREGVTCIACHRVQIRYGKSNGERRIEPGPIFAPVFGGIGGEGVAETIHRKDHFKVKTSPDEKGPGQDMHVAGIYFDQLSKSEFCASCHQVAVHPGIKLEVVWEQYRASPACKKGIRCQDCHMGRVPGVPSGFEFGAAAVVADKKVNENRKHSNHIFYGPGYSIAHPGVFPFHQKADRWTIDQWLLFDWRAGWGTDDFEDAVDDGQVHINFPPVWKEADDRYDARDIIEDNLKKLNEKREIRTQVMENGSHVDGPVFKTPPCVGKDLRFHYVVTNTNEGHNLLTASLGAQPQLWANIVLIGPDGRRLWETGYTDSYGDVADIHSVDVRNGRVPFDWQLFNLQTMFLITGAKGTDREFYLPVNLDFDQLPFLRPGVQPISTINHPPFIRMESRSLAALGSRKVPYRVPGHLIRQPGLYRLSFRMRSRAEPIYFMRFVGATIDMQRAMNERMIDVHQYSVEFVVR